MRFLLTISLALLLGTAHADSVRLLIQNSPLAGSQYYALDTFWDGIRVGDPLTLMAGVMREPWWSFLLLVTLAKTGRYLVLAAITLGWAG